ncbi:hypothetical protein [Parabacteroides sp. FAFU027]|uniref:hypothetical protein n=1 Tax=Parabacteroides sp. FAFU027 TaxID=2922715 RepID=UPI001FAEA1A4|nr:hypothetical protein [Parabacteroides sp. FAFU027]
MKLFSKLFSSLFLFVFVVNLNAQDNDVSKKHERKKNLTVKEWNTKDNKRFLDHQTVYNEAGKKIEESEYSAYGLRERVVSEYDAQGRCCKQVIYNDRNKVNRIRKIEYNPDGSRKCQYNYYPNGKLESVKVYEYSNDN